MANVKCELYHDNLQNFRSYNIPKAQLLICDVPYNIGTDFRASRPDWYINGDNQNGESKLAHRPAFNTDLSFNLIEFMHFANRMLKKEPEKGGPRGRSSDAPCMIVFCSFEQTHDLIHIAAEYGFKHYIVLTLIKNYSPSVLKANMRPVSATEYGLIFYRNRLPKFRNLGPDGKHHMFFNWIEMKRDNSKEYPRIHPSQKPVSLLKKLIETFTDPGDVVIDPVAGSGSTLRAAWELGRPSYGFEVSRDFYNKAQSKMLAVVNKGVSE